MIKNATNQTRKVIAQLQELWRFIDDKSRHSLISVLLLSIVTSAAEVMSIGAVVPFITSVTSSSSPAAALFATTAFCAATLAVAGIRVANTAKTNKSCFRIGADISNQVFSRTIYRTYDHHCKTNTSDALSGITIKSNSITSGIIIPLLTLVNGLIVTSAITAALVIIDPGVAIIAIGGVATIYLITLTIVTRKLSSNSWAISNAITKTHRTVQEALSGIREIILGDYQKLYIDLHKEQETNLRLKQASNATISALPRFIVESFGTIIIAWIAFVTLKQSTQMSEGLPVLAALALAAQRMLPITQQVYSSWSTLVGTQSILSEVLWELSTKAEQKPVNNMRQDLPFREKVQVKNLYFKYNGNVEYTLKNINTEIQPGDRIAIRGRSGAGKSTLIDLLMGLHIAEEGAVLIDGKKLTHENARSWQKRISHVPQSIFLADGTIKQNIAFGETESEINMQRVIWAAKIADIDSSINGWKEGYCTAVGERGVRLSGGERQRIGIARAVYKLKEVLVLDEATSALDYKTEKQIIDNLVEQCKNLTIIVISHRKETQDFCDRVIEVKHSSIKESRNKTDET